ncbi:MAG: dTDP-glucose 4,6-dehydratase, partial [Anaerolineaceae bacterium]|nr:dTDP-glucose 4,6-dehydratase [Anaerolineaceae bacterium]
AGSVENLSDLPSPKRHEFVHGNIIDADTVESIIREKYIDTIVHFAAETHVDKSIIGPAKFIETNIIGTFNLLETVRRNWLEGDPKTTGRVHFHHVSTDEVYGSLSHEENAFTEETSYKPRSPYSASKASSDHLVRSYYHTYGLPVTITNCSNNYGPYQFPEKLIPVVILNAIAGLPIPIYGDGRQIRDWLHVEDHCNAIHLVIQKGELGETYLVGGNNQPSNIELVELICSILDELLPESAFIPHQNLIQFVKDRPGHDRRYDVNISKIRKRLGWTPRITFEAGILDTVRWYLENSTWIEKIQQRDEYAGWIQMNYEKRGEGKK